jgi:hypothetical protein
MKEEGFGFGDTLILLGIKKSKLFFIIHSFGRTRPLS